MRVTIRPATAADGLALQQIERSAGLAFAEVGLPEVANDEPASIEDLARYAAAGRSWVAVNDDGDQLGYVLVDIVDENAHVEQVSVEPKSQGAGVGRALMEHVSTWAREAGIVAITLTTFKVVPWNAPLYRHLGFSDLEDSEIGPELQAVRDAETAHGLDPHARVCMRLVLEPR